MIFTLLVVVSLAIKPLSRWWKRKKEKLVHYFLESNQITARNTEFNKPLTETGVARYLGEGKKIKQQLNSDVHIDISLCVRNITVAW